MYEEHKVKLDIASKITLESVCRKFERKLVEEKDNRSSSWAVRNSIKNARETLKQGRHTLMHSYVFCCYLKDNTAKTVFEDSLKILQKKVEELGVLLEIDIHKMGEIKKLHDLVSIVNFCKDQSDRTINFVKENKWDFLYL